MLFNISMNIHMMSTNELNLSVCAKKTRLNLLSPLYRKIAVMFWHVLFSSRAYGGADAYI